MRVTSRLADVEFHVGSIERAGNDLLINSDPGQQLRSRIYVSPQDALRIFWKLLSSPAAWVFLLGFPIFYLRSRKSPER